MWPIVLAATVLCVLVVIVGRAMTAEKEKQKRKLEAQERRECIKKHGCTPEELACRIKDAPYLETLADDILSLPNLPPEIEVHCSHLYVVGTERSSSRLIWFKDYKIPDIPVSCCAVLAEALADTTKLSKHYRPGGDVFGGEAVCVLKLKEESRT